MAERSYRGLFWGLAVAGAVLDQVTKYGVFRWLGARAQTDPETGELAGVQSVVANVFELRAAYQGKDLLWGQQDGLLAALRTWSSDLVPRVNHGALFGWLNQHVGLANALFAAISVVAAVAIAYWSSRPSARHDRSLSAALGLILAGTLGNLYDRLVFNGVRDFLHLHYYNAFDWPVFNVADCCLVLGALLLLAQAFFGRPATAPTGAARAGAPQEMASAR
jgi:lipoprotein signal peptidase